MICRASWAYSAGRPKRDGKGTHWPRERRAGSGKPADIVAKMVEGRLRKSLGEITLAGQAFVKDPDVTIEKLLKNAKPGAAPAEVTAYERFEVGAGIEKKQEDFVAEVMAQVSGATPAKH